MLPPRVVAVSVATGADLVEAETVLRRHPWRRISLVVVGGLVAALLWPGVERQPLREFWADFCAAGGQVIIGAGLVLAMDGQPKWDYIGNQDALALARVISCLTDPKLRLVSPVLMQQKATTQGYTADQRRVIEAALLDGGTAAPLSMPELESNSLGALSNNTVLVGGPSVNEITRKVLARMHGITDDSSSAEGIRKLTRGYAFILKDASRKPILNAFNWPRQQAVNALPPSTRDRLTGFGVLDLDSLRGTPPRCVFFEAARLTTVAGRLKYHEGPRDYGLVIKIRHQANGSACSLVILMGYGGRGTLAAARAATSPAFLFEVNRKLTGDRNYVELLVETEDEPATPRIVRTDAQGHPLDNPRAYAVQWR